MNKLIKYFVTSTYKPLLVKYLSKTRTYVYKDIILSIPPAGISSRVFLQYKIVIEIYQSATLQAKAFLELGAGSGLISIFAAKQGATVTATDINPVAIEFLERNQTT